MDAPVHVEAHRRHGHQAIRRFAKQPEVFPACHESKEFAVSLPVFLRRSREMTILCSPKVIQHHIGAVAVLPPGKRTRPGHLGPSAKTNWLGKNEWVTSNREARRRGLPILARAGERGQILFFVWVDLSEHKWVI